MFPHSGQNGWGEHKGVLAHEALQSSYRVGRVRTKALGFVEPCFLRGGFVTIAVENKPVSSQRLVFLRANALSFRRGSFCRFGAH